MTSVDMLTAARAEALFTSDLTADSCPSCPDVANAIRNAVRAHGGTHGCLIEVAGEYGEHPETAARRMRWALSVVEASYPAQSMSGAPRNDFRPEIAMVQDGPRRNGTPVRPQPRIARHKGAI